MGVTVADLKVFDLKVLPGNSTAQFMAHTGNVPVTLIAAVRRRSDDITLFW